MFLFHLILYDCVLMFVVLFILEEDLYVSSSVGRIGGLLSSLAQAEEEKKHTEGPPGGRVPMTNNDMRSENLHHENVNYMGYSDRVQRGVYVLLKTQVNWCRYDGLIGWVQWKRQMWGGEGAGR